MTAAELVERVAMTEPSERDLEMAFELCQKARLSVKHNGKMLAEALAASRAEERERCAKIAEGFHWLVAANIAARIRSGQ